MIKSMTAYADAEKTQNSVNVKIEMRSYNSRHLDINLRMPQGYPAVEEKLRALIAESIARGRVEVRVAVRDESEGSTAYEVDVPKARAYQKALIELKELIGASGEIPLELIAARGDMIRPVEQPRDADYVWPVVATCAREALGAVDVMRRREGAHIADDFVVRLKTIENHLLAIREKSKGLPAQYRDRLRERIQVLAKDVIRIDEGRVEQEAALLADKSDISEEIVRAESHIKQFHTIMAGDAPAGQPLNFLLQEFNREFNTIGSKTGKSEVAHMVVAVKSELEKLREQVQNIE
ncbi:MAG: YicC family protein [Deltaproteobacteria bacterium]|nr:YicC family protein [Deltaproteobacteria bacterium]